MSVHFSAKEAWEGSLGRKIQRLATQQVLVLTSPFTCFIKSFKLNIGSHYVALADMILTEATVKGMCFLAQADTSTHTRKIKEGTVLGGLSECPGILNYLHKVYRDLNGFV